MWTGTGLVGYISYDNQPFGCESSYVAKLQASPCGGGGGGDGQLRRMLSLSDDSRPFATAEVSAEPYSTSGRSRQSLKELVTASIAQLA